MKKLIAFSLSLFFVLACLPLSVWADDSTVAYGDSFMLSYGDADTLEVSGQTYTVPDEVEFSANILISDCSSNFSKIYLNGQSYQKLTDGMNTVKLKVSDLIDGENELRIYLGTDFFLYTEEGVYGESNIDDVTVESVTFDGISDKMPSKVNFYMPIVGAAGMTCEPKEYLGQAIKVGDGWFQDTNLGGSTPDVPVSIGYVFEKPVTAGVFFVDTTKLSDGEHTVTYKKDGAVLSTQKIIVDNTAPKISFSIVSGASVDKNQSCDIIIDDITETTTTLLINDKPANKIDPSLLYAGSHKAFVTVTDAAGNSASKMLLFDVVENNYNVELSDDEVKMSGNGEATVYTGKLLTNMRLYENRYGELNQDYLRSSDEVLISFDDKAEIETKAIGNSVPYQSFVVDTEGAEGDAIVSYTGETGNGCGIVLKAWNYKESRWDVIGKTESGVPVSIAVDTETYSYKKKMRINATPDMVYNGSDTILWNSDTQYYSRFDELNEFYYKINNYAVEQYNSGNIGYCVHTGDLVDQTDAGDDLAHKQYQVADKAHDILDNACIPNGVVSGNHDIVHSAADYSYFWQYFGEDRYKDFPWYGGSLNNNMHHYDLVSIGAHDFVFLYVGTYYEDDPDFIAWANEVCKMYPSRNVILCTHEYLLPSGEYSSPDRSEVLWNEVVVPNENVVMILCGHNDGVCDRLRQVGNSDRYVLEILADYQFAEIGGDTPQNVLNGITCDGEGFIRLMTFNELGQVITNTYSPVADEYGMNPNNYYPSYKESFIYDIKFVESNRSVKTTEFNVIVEPELVGTVKDGQLDVGEYDAVYAEIKSGDNTELSKIYVLDEYSIDYSVPEHTYETPSYSKVEASGLEHVSEYFRMDTDNVKPTDSWLEVGLDLLPTDVSSLKYSSGSSKYTVEKNDRGGFKVKHSMSGSTHWLTLGNTLSDTIDIGTYDRLYFGVTAGDETKWNITVNFLGKTINFSQNEIIASQFGYVYQKPSDITGTWCGYIDLKEALGFESGVYNLHSVYLTTASPDNEVTFDYLFFGKSNAGKVRFITTDSIVSTVDCKIGETVSLPASPFKQGYIFDGWYTEKDGGQKIEGSVKVGEDGLAVVYAHFVENNSTSKRPIEKFNTEVNLETFDVSKLIFVIISLVFMIAVAGFLFFKIKKSKN